MQAGICIMCYASDDEVQNKFDLYRDIDLQVRSPRHPSSCRLPRWQRVPAPWQASLWNTAQCAALRQPWDCFAAARQQQPPPLLLLLCTRAQFAGSREETLLSSCAEALAQCEEKRFATAIAGVGGNWAARGERLMHMPLARWQTAGTGVCCWHHGRWWDAAGMPGNLVPNCCTAEFDALTRLDAWKTNMLLRVKRRLQARAAGEEQNGDEDEELL